MSENIRLIVNTFDNNGVVNGIKEIDYNKKDLINIINKFNQNNALTLKNNNHETHNNIEEKNTNIKNPLIIHKKESTDFLSIILKNPNKNPAKCRVD